MTINIKNLLSILIAVIWYDSFAFTLIIESDKKLKNLQIIEHYGINPTLVMVGSNEIELKNYPNAIYFMQLKGRSDCNFQSMIWVPSDTSIVQVKIDFEYNVVFESKSPCQLELNKIFKASNTYSLFPYEPQDTQPLEPILALEAKAIIQNLKVQTDQSALKNLYKLSQQRGIDNWSTDVLSSYLKPSNKYYDPLARKLIKISGLDSLENQVEIKPTQKKYLLLAISGSWCGPCIKGIPKLRNVHDNLSNNIIFVSTWNDPDLETFINNHHEKKKLITWPNLWDQYGLMANAFQVEAYPSYILFDQFGNELNRWSGKFPNDLNDFTSE